MKMEIDETWEKIGTPVIYRKKCEDCDGKGETTLTMVGPNGEDYGKSTHSCSCSHTRSLWGQEKGYVYLSRYEVLETKNDPSSGPSGS